MTTTNTSKTTEMINEQLARLEWMIADSKRELAKAATEMQRRAENAVKECEAMLADQPCSLMWTEFAEGDLRTAKEAKARLNQLLEQQKLLQFVSKSE